jgi:hypothetical protein
VALSDSIETPAGSSAATRAPGATITSITGMSLKSPMSGTLTSIVFAMIVSLPVTSDAPVPAAVAFRR